MARLHLVMRRRGRNRGDGPGGRAAVVSSRPAGPSFPKGNGKVPWPGRHQPPRPAFFCAPRLALRSADDNIGRAVFLHSAAHSAGFGGRADRYTTSRRINLLQVGVFETMDAQGPTPHGPPGTPPVPPRDPARPPPITEPPPPIPVPRPEPPRQPIDDPPNAAPVGGRHLLGSRTIDMLLDPGC